MIPFRFDLLIESEIKNIKISPAFRGSSSGSFDRR
jgi:hypothetical protein